ncbi:MAG: hypothetical protein ABI024_01060 [Vicinamibacterales bacterium]
MTRRPTTARSPGTSRPTWNSRCGALNADWDDLTHEIGDAHGETTIMLLRDKQEMTLKALSEDDRR